VVEQAAFPQRVTETWSQAGKVKKGGGRNIKGRVRVITEPRGAPYKKILGTWQAVSLESNEGLKTEIMETNNTLSTWAQARK